MWKEGDTPLNKCFKVLQSELSELFLFQSQQLAMELNKEIKVKRKSKMNEEIRREVTAAYAKNLN